VDSPRYFLRCSAAVASEQCYLHKAGGDWMLIGWLQIMDGDNESKSSFVFKMFDADGSGEMDLNEVQ